MSIKSIIDNLPGLIKLKGASQEQIKDAEKQLGLRFSNEYREYLAEFGRITAIGIEITGIANAKYSNVVYVTKQEWELNPDVPHNMYVIQNLGIEGIIIWQNTSGTIFQTAPNVKPKQIARSLAEYISERSKNYNECSIFESVKFI